MISIALIQNNRRLEVTAEKGRRDDDDAIAAVLRTLEKSSVGTHQALARQIRGQIESPAGIIRFTMDPQTARRVEQALGYPLETRGKYSNEGSMALHQKLCRFLSLPVPSMFV